MVAELALVEPDALLRLWRYLHAKRNAQSVRSQADSVLLAAVTRELLIRRLL